MNCEGLLSGSAALPCLSNLKAEEIQGLFLSCGHTGRTSQPVTCFKDFRDSDNFVTCIELENLLSAGNQLRALWDISFPAQKAGAP